MTTTIINDDYDLRFNTSVPLADANIPARHILAPVARAVGACPYLLPFNCIFMGLGCYNLLQTENIATGQGCKFAVSVGRPRAKMLSASGASPP